MLVDFLLRRRIALAGPRQRLRVQMADFVESVAERLANTDGLTAEPVREMPQRVVLDDFPADQAGAGRKPIAHHVGDQLRPALAPDILRHEGAVGVGEEAANLLGAVGDAAMHFADPEDGVFRAGLAGGALDLTWRVQLDGDRAGNRAQGLAPADDARDRLLVHAVLQRDDIAVRREILLDHGRRPGRVVGLRADKSDVERLFLADLLQFGDMQGAGRHRKRLDIAQMGDRQPMLFHVLDVLGPEIDKGHVLAGLDHMRAGIAADRSRAHHRNLLARRHHPSSNRSGPRSAP